MFTKSKLLCVAVSVAACAALPTLANAKKGHHHMHVVDSKSGDVLFDDGVDDNKVCAAKKVTIWDPKKQDFVDTLKKVKCNF